MAIHRTVKTRNTKGSIKIKNGGKDRVAEVALQNNKKEDIIEARVKRVTRTNK